MDSKLQAIKFLESQNAGVIATVGVDSKPNSSVIYYVLGGAGSLLFMTKTSTAKYTNILTNRNVSICVYGEKERFTVQVYGKAHEVKDEAQQIEILDKLAKARSDGEDTWMPPVSHLKDGKLVVMRVDIEGLTMADFAKFDGKKKSDVIEKVEL